MKITGKITKIKEVNKGTSKAGKAYSTVQFLVETTEEYNNLYCFDVFQMDDNDKAPVDQFIKFNKEGQNVDVDFNVKTTEWEGKHFTKLSCWKVFKAEAVAEIPVMEGTQEAMDDLPF